MSVLICLTSCADGCFHSNKHCRATEAMFQDSKPFLHCGCNWMGHENAGLLDYCPDHIHIINIYIYIIIIIETYIYICVCVCVFQFHSEQTKRSRDGPFKDTQRLEACSHFKPLVCRSMFMVTARVPVEPSLQERCRDSLKVCYMLFLPRENTRTHEHLPTLFSGFIWVGLPC